jgi:hypothetical protein
MVDQLMVAIPKLVVTKQSDWLQHWGMNELVDEGMKYWEKHKSFPNTYAAKMRSRRTEANLLGNQKSFGQFIVFTLTF